MVCSVTNRKPQWFCKCHLFQREKSLWVIPRSTFKIKHFITTKPEKCEGWCSNGEQTMTSDPASPRCYPSAQAFLSCCPEGKRVPVAQTSMRSISLPVNTVLEAVRKENLHLCCRFTCKAGPGAISTASLVSLQWHAVESTANSLGIWEIRLETGCTWGFGQWSSTHPWLSEMQPGENELCKSPQKTQLYYFEQLPQASRLE